MFTSFPKVSHDAIEVTAPLENGGHDVTARATGSTWYRHSWACNLEQCRIMPSASSQSSVQIAAQMDNDLNKNVLNLLEKKVRNLEKRKVSFWLSSRRPNASLRSSRPRHVWYHPRFWRGKIRFCSQGKLDSYKKLVETGQTLNEDQKVRLLEMNFRYNLWAIKT